MKDKRKTVKPQEKVKVNEIFLLVADVINGELRDAGKFPPFGRTLYVVKTGGVSLPIEELDNGVARYVEIEDIAHSIVRYLANEVNIPAYYLNYQQAVLCARTWLGVAKEVPIPEPVSWKSDPGLTFSRLPWDFDPDSEFKHPTFDEWLSRTTNAEAFCVWVGSLFFKDSYRQQYPWLCSDGGTGKGAMLRVLRKIFKQAFAAKQVPHVDDKHWTAGLLDKRLVAFPDCNNASFITSGLFKNLTGDDPVDINPKFKAPFTADLTCKFIFLSNRKPMVQDLSADLRRIILCEMTDPGELSSEAITGYEEKLWSECGYFLSTCVNLYQERNKNHGPIEVETSGVEDIIDHRNEEFDALFSRHLILVKDHVLPSKDLVERLKTERITDRKYQEFVRFFSKKYGIFNGRFTIDGKQQRGYSGIKLTDYDFRDYNVNRN